MIYGKDITAPLSIKEFENSGTKQVFVAADNII